MRNIIIIILLAIAAIALCWFLQSPYDPLNADNIAIEKYLESRDYNTRNYKCALVKEYSNGKTTVEYHLHKEGC